MSGAVPRRAPGRWSGHRSQRDLKQEIAAGTLMWVKVAGLSIPRQTFMIYREHGQHSDAARELIGIVRSFNWESTTGPLVRPIRKRA